MPTWPTYRAIDYKSDYRHRLSASDLTLIRKTLALLEPCKRSNLRYAIPSNPDVLPFVLMLYRDDVAAEHILWTHNQYMDRHDGNVFPASGVMPDWNGVAYEASAITC